MLFDSVNKIVLAATNFDEYLNVLQKNQSERLQSLNCNMND